MPWEIKEDFGECKGFAVVKIDDETIEGCHETMEKAEAQLAALNISEVDEDKADEEIVEDEPEDKAELEPEQKQDELLEVREGFVIVEVETDEVIVGHLTEEAANDELKELLEVTEEVEEAVEEVEEKAGKRMKSPMVKKLKEAVSFLKELVSWGEYQDKQKTMLSSLDMITDKGFAIKEIDGEPWIITWSSNAFEDRDKEIISTKALEQWSEKINRQDVKGFFNLWHLANTDFAKKEWTGVPGRILVEAGPFLKNEKGKAALEFFKQHLENHQEIAPEGWGCSIEFKYLPDERETGIFENVEITRTSILPRFAAANIHTQIKEIKMSMTDEQKQAAMAVFGKELGTSLVGGAENKSKELEANIVHKNGTKEDFSLAQIVEAVAEKIQLDLEPITDALGQLAEGQQVNANQIKSIQTQEAIKDETETPRYVLQLFDTASKSNETKVTDDDDLTKNKPAETISGSTDLLSQVTSQQRGA